MPESKSRPKSKRPAYVQQKPAKPKPSPRWLAPLGLALIGLGLLLIILNYLVASFPGGNYNLVVGFVLMAGGLGVLSQWR